MQFSEWTNKALDKLRIRIILTHIQVYFILLKIAYLEVFFFNSYFSNFSSFITHMRVVLYNCQNLHNFVSKREVKLFDIITCFYADNRRSF